jgi:hypothetical protein
LELHDLWLSAPEGGAQLSDLTKRTAIAPSIDGDDRSVGFVGIAFAKLGFARP